MVFVARGHLIGWEAGKGHGADSQQGCSQGSGGHETFARVLCHI